MSNVRPIINKENADFLDSSPGYIYNMTQHVTHVVLQCLLIYFSLTMLFSCKNSKFILFF